MDYSEVLRRMAVDEINHPHVYFIGKGARQVSLSAQQNRAFNLMWAISEGHRSKNDYSSQFSVVVIGGGLAGMTAAAAAYLIGGHVTLIEEKSELMHLQRGSRLRFIHPYVAEWPFVDSAYPITKLPILNWTAGTANSVTQCVLQQWNRLFDGKIDVYLNHRVTNVACFANRCTVTAENDVSFTEKENHQTRSYDYAILATGFGLEAKFPNLPQLSYWENDNLSQPVIAGNIPKRVLVSGCGDGGLIDVIRLSLKDFDHGSFTNFMVSNPEMKSVEAALREIEVEANDWAQSDEARAAVLSLNANLSACELVPKNKIFESIIGQLLLQKYQEINVPDSIKNKFVGMLRVDTQVTLLGSSSAPFRPSESFVFNRFAIHLLRRWGKLRYWKGRLRKVIHTKSGTFRAIVKNAFGVKEARTFDQIIVRHGPESPLARLFSPEIVNTLNREVIEAPDPLITPLYSSDYFQHSLARNVMRSLKFRHASSNLTEAFIDKLESIAALSLTFTDDNYSYDVTINGVPPNNSPEPILGVAVNYKRPAVYANLTAVSGSEKFLLPSVSLHRFDDPKFKNPISCFVRKPGNKNLLYVVLPYYPLLTDDMRLHINDSPVAEVQSKDGWHAPKDWDKLDTFIIAMVFENITYRTTVPLNAQESKVLGIRKPQVGLRVFRYVPGPGKTIAGRICSIAQKDVIPFWDGKSRTITNILSIATEEELIDFPAAMGGASYDEDGFLVGIPISIVPGQWIEMAAWDIIKPMGLRLACSLSETLDFRQELLIRLQKYGKGRSNSSLGNGGTEYLQIGPCIYLLEEEFSENFLREWRKLQKEGLLEQLGSEYWGLRTQKR